MHQDDTNLARQLFAAAMAKLEDATIIAARGQSASITSTRVAREAQNLRIVAQDVAAIAEATLALTHHIDTNLQTPLRKRR